MPRRGEDKSRHCLAFLVRHLRDHARRHHGTNVPPFFLGINGMHGSGKTMLVSFLERTLRSPPFSLPVVTLSLDDFYLTHTEQVTLAWEHSTNPLLQDRGQPSTHDLALGGEVFDSLAAERPTAIPRYNKSACEGWGDRAPKDQWKLVNQEGERTAKVIIIEGWCIGYRAWDDQTLRAKWEDAVHKSKFGVYVGKLAYVKFEHMKVINDALRNYDVLTDKLDAIVHLDPVVIRNVYVWRRRQERIIFAMTGTRLTLGEIENAVDRFFPSYELYGMALREGLFKPPCGSSSSNSDWKGRQLRLAIAYSGRVSGVAFI